MFLKLLGVITILYNNLLWPQVQVGGRSEGRGCDRLCRLWNLPLSLTAVQTRQTRLNGLVGFLQFLKCFQQGPFLGGDLTTLEFAEDEFLVCYVL